MSQPNPSYFALCLGFGFEETPISWNSLTCIGGFRNHKSVSLFLNSRISILYCQLRLSLALVATPLSKLMSSTFSRIIYCETLNCLFAIF